VPSIAATTQQQQHSSLRVDCALPQLSKQSSSASEWAHNYLSFYATKSQAYAGGQEKTVASVCDGSDGDGSSARSRKIAMAAEAHGPLFKPFRALGYITEDVPFAVQRRGKETYVTVSVGRTWQV
jgi:hypothetical protein